MQPTEAAGAKREYLSVRRANRAGPSLLRSEGACLHHRLQGLKRGGVSTGEGSVA